jgi:hypothetical protein
MLKEEDKEPDIGPFRLYLDAFQELSTCRVNSMVLGPIPFTAIIEYSRLFDVGDFNEFHYCIRAMDNELLRLEAEQAKKKRPPNSGATASKKK